MRNRQSEYMHWAKLHSRATYNLATSGVGPFPFKELVFDPQELEINGPSRYGYEPLQKEIAKKYNVDPECVVAAAGTSMANHLAMAALVSDGDEVLVEQPGYELLTASALYFTSQVRRLPRDENTGFQIDLRQAEKAISSRTRLIVVSNLHNPSSVLASESELQYLGDLARRVGAHVLVDEVYLDAVYENTPRSSFHYGAPFLVTSSLTKVYGLSGLRCGWILAQPDLARAMWRLNDLFGSIPAFPAEQLSVAAFQQIAPIRERARRVVDADRTLLHQFLDRNPELSAVRTSWGTTSLVKLRRPDVPSFVHRLRSDFDTSVVPGRFFDMPDHFRIGMGVDHAMFAEGLRRIELALAS